MIVVWGVIEIAEEKIEAALEISLGHVRRSREEPGCVSHSVCVDAENSCRLVFFEEWQSMDALQIHFAVPASGRFVNEISQLATAKPVMKLYDSQQIQPA
ncbi:MAG: putative quinol monooxygenase [Gammaproteobacteria bacterium]